MIMEVTPEFVDIYVKFVYTSLSKMYSVDVNLPIQTIIEEITNNESQPFKLELVKVSDTAPGVRAEDSPNVLEPYFEETLKQRFPNNYHNLAFYIRVKR